MHLCQLPQQQGKAMLCCAQAQQQRAKQKKGRRWGATAGSKLKFDVPSRSAAATAEVSDFHWHLAASDRIR